VNSSLFRCRPLEPRESGRQSKEIATERGAKKVRTKWKKGEREKSFKRHFNLKTNEFCILERFCLLMEREGWGGWVMEEEEEDERKGGNKRGPRWLPDSE
jgi:hypothetical protein